MNKTGVARRPFFFALSGEVRAVTLRTITIAPSHGHGIMSSKQRTSRTGKQLSQRSLRGSPSAAVMGTFRQAVGFHANGQIAMADHLYRQVLALDPQHAEALHWLGVIEGQNGNPARALALLECSVASNPNDPVAFNDLGTAQRVLNRREEALASYARALALKPDYAKALIDRGAVLHELLRLEEARESLEQALTLTPGDVEALLMSCRVLTELGEVDAALARCMNALALEDSHRTQAMFAEVLKSARFSGGSASLESYMVRAMSEPWGRPIELAPAATAYLRLNAGLMQSVARADAAAAGGLSLQALFDGVDAEAVCADPVLLAVMMHGLIADRTLERFLTAMRRALLDAFNDGRVSPSPVLLAFQCALAQQCFVNEYVFALAEEEARRADALRKRLEDEVSAGTPPPAMLVALAASYFALGEMAASGKLLDQPWPAPLLRVLTQQLQEPAAEKQIAADIRSLTEVDDAVSQQVRRQYEENPYPRWVSYPLNVTPTTLDDYLGGRFAHAQFQRMGKANADLDVLIAGCGTGQHSIEAALLFRGARILAIDLSRASLAYALRKTRELKIPGIEYAQADVLAMGQCGRQFDLIESMGVLHHLADPARGWRSLLALLRPGGFMRIGLYSERARQPVVACRKFLVERGYLPTAAGIRAGRQVLLTASSLGDIGSVVNSADFHASSAVRDLLFHVQEHRFGLPNIRRLLAEFGLDFIGFEIDNSVLRQYCRRFPADPAMNNLDSWDAFEAESPLTFSGMYQFWVQKLR